MTKIISSNYEKPTFEIDSIKAEIKGLPTIEENMKQALEYATNLREYYQNLVFSENDIKFAKEEKANVNKVIAKVDDLRKKIVKEYNKPIENFVTLSKETVNILNETYSFINNQVKSYEQEQLDERTIELREFFGEHIKESIPMLEDYVTLNDANINVTLSSSMKSLKDKLLAFVEKLKNDVALIELEEFRGEIFNEYIKEFDFARAKLTVLNRKMELEKIETNRKTLEEKQKEEEKVVAKVDEILSPPKEIDGNDWTTNEVNYIPEISLTLYNVAGYYVRELKEWLDERKIKYE